MLCKVEGAVKEAGVRHLVQFNELHGLQVQHHGIFGASTVVVASEDDDLVA